MAGARPSIRAFGVPLIVVHCLMTTQSKPSRMTVAEFLDWASTQPRGRYELVQGEVVAMAP